MAKRNLSTQDILNQQFKKGMRGYDSVEVDEFLDLIIQDYNEFEKEIAVLRREREQLMEQLSKNSAPTESEPTTPQPGTTNYDILKRLSNLEKHVFGAKLDN